MTTDKLSLSQLASTWWQRSWGLVGDWSSWGLDHVVYRPSFIESSLTCVPSPIWVLCFCAAIVSRIPLFFLVPRYELPASQEPFIARLASKEERRILFGCMFFNHFIVFLSIHTIIPLCILFIKIRCNYMQVYIYIYTLLLQAGLQAWGGTWFVVVDHGEFRSHNVPKKLWRQDFWFHEESNDPLLSCFVASLVKKLNAWDRRQY